MAVWSAAGSVLALVPFAPALVAALVYAVTYGLAEAMRLPLRAPESRWQVPSTWVAGRTSQQRAVVWGVMLGPGVLTRNPYAGMWLVPLLLAIIASPALGAVAGGLVGLAHGLARGAGVLWTLRHRHACELPWQMVLARMRWQTADGAALLLTAAAIVAVYL